MNAHATSDLEACYYHQTSKLFSLVEERIGTNRKVVELITKVSPRMEYHAVMANGLNRENYEDKNRLLGGAGKEILFQEYHVEMCHA